MVLPRRVFLGGATLGLACRTGEASKPRREWPPEMENQGESVHIAGIPHIRQRPDFCGEACVAMVLRHMGHAADQDDVYDASGLNPELGRGCYTPDLKKAMERLGFDPGPVWFELPGTTDGDAAVIDESWARVISDLRAGVPAVLCMHYNRQPNTTEHIRLIVGYDADKGEVIYHEPAEDEGAELRMPLRRLKKLWPLRDNDGGRFLVHLRAAPRSGGSIAIPPVPETHRPATYCQAIMTLRERLGGEAADFTILVEEPFIVAGDDPPERVRQHSKRTIRWAVDRLRAAYFDHDPQELNTVWLFKGEKSYERHARELFSDRPDTPYGYYARRHKALIMNITTGGGTLVHEIVHPFIESNFPSCPAWFDEGLASLYEQCMDKDGAIWGLTNWRLAGLQEAINDRGLPTFRALCNTGDTFYTDDPGTHYAQARYLCFWLQEQGLLRQYYRAFREGHAQDPSGYTTLQKTVGRKDMVAFQRDWERFVLGLRYG